MVIFHYFSVMECDLQLQYNLEIASRVSRAFDNGSKSKEIFAQHSYCNNSYWGWDASENNVYYLYNECKIKFSLETWDWWTWQYYWERSSNAYVQIISGFKCIRKRPGISCMWVSAEQLCLESKESIFYVVWPWWRLHLAKEFMEKQEKTESWEDVLICTSCVFVFQTIILIFLR